MSRIGNKPVEIPQGVDVAIDAHGVKLKGPRGELALVLGEGVVVETGEKQLKVVRRGSSRQSLANFGTTRALLANMVKGVTQGWTRKLELEGVGFTAKLAGNNLVLNVGFSHEVVLPVPAVVKCSTPSSTAIELESIDKEVLGTFAAKIRKVQPPEPYLGKGIKYAGEVIRRKAGKTGKSGK